MRSGGRGAIEVDSEKNFDAIILCCHVMISCQVSVIKWFVSNRNGAVVGVVSA